MFHRLVVLFVDNDFFDLKNKIHAGSCFPVNRCFLHWRGRKNERIVYKKVKPDLYTICELLKSLLLKLSLQFNLAHQS